MEEQVSVTEIRVVATFLGNDERKDRFCGRLDIPQHSPRAFECVAIAAQIETNEVCCRLDSESSSDLNKLCKVLKRKCSYKLLWLSSA